VRALTNVLGIDTLNLRETMSGLRIDGPLTAIARLTPALDRVFEEPGALGVILAGLLSGPRQQMIIPGGPRGLA
jgi:hypothetical protein